MIIHIFHADAHQNGNILVSGLVYLTRKNSESLKHDIRIDSKYESFYVSMMMAIFLPVRYKSSPFSEIFEARNIYNGLLLILTLKR